MDQRTEYCRLRAEQCAQVAVGTHSRRSRDEWAMLALCWSICAEDRAILEAIRGRRDHSAAQVGASLELIALGQGQGGRQNPLR